LDTRPHIKFKRQATRLSIITFIVGVIIFLTLVFSILNGNEKFTVLSVLMFGCLIIITFAVLFILMFNIHCPNCKNKLKTQINHYKKRGIATCQGCSITWTLGISIGDPDFGREIWR
jgi:uncharacterized membrane protein